VRKFAAFIRDNSWTYNGGLVTLLTVTGVLRLQIGGLFIGFIAIHALAHWLAGDE
jgi:hypothetical protein